MNIIFSDGFSGFGAVDRSCKNGFGPLSSTASTRNRSQSRMLPCRSQIFSDSLAIFFETESWNALSVPARINGSNLQSKHQSKCKKPQTQARGNFNVLVDGSGGALGNIHQFVEAVCETACHHLCMKVNDLSKIDNSPTQKGIPKIFQTSCGNVTMGTLPTANVCNVEYAETTGNPSKITFAQRRRPKSVEEL